MEGHLGRAAIEIGRNDLALAAREIQDPRSSARSTATGSTRIYSAKMTIATP
jgi:hypothetical protein